MNAILYRTGCQWRALPHDFPKSKMVYTIFWRWRQDGLWQRLYEALCRRVRQQSGKKPTPQHGDPRQSVDSHRRRRRGTRLRRRQEDHWSQSAHRRRYAGPQCGPWSCMERTGRITMEPCSCCTNSKRSGVCECLFADSAYARNGLPAWVQETFGWLLQTVLRPIRAKGFGVLPKRWIVERTSAWLARCQRNSKDYERLQIDERSTSSNALRDHANGRATAIICATELAPPGHGAAHRTGGDAPARISMSYPD